MRFSLHALLNQFARETFAPAAQLLDRLVLKAALLFAAFACLIASSIFLTIDLYDVLKTSFGPIIAAASVGGAYLLVAIVCLVLALRTLAPSHETESPKGPSGEKRHGADRESDQASLYAANIDGIVTPLLAVLRESGLKRESVAVEVGAAMAKQMNPVAFVVLTIAAGFILGRVLTPPRSDKPPA